MFDLLFYTQTKKQTTVGAFGHQISRSCAFLVLYTDQVLNLITDKVTRYRIFTVERYLCGNGNIRCVSSLGSVLNKQNKGQLVTSIQFDERYGSRQQTFINHLEI